jgi:hypothetical protein
MDEFRCLWLLLDMFQHPSLLLSSFTVPAWGTLVRSESFCKVRKSEAIIHRDDHDCNNGMMGLDRTSN